MLECVAGNCEREPTEEVVINDTGLLLVYAVCALHRLAIARSDMMTMSTDPKRGLIGPA